MQWSQIKKTLLYRGFFKLTAHELQHDLFAGGESPVLIRELLDRGDAVGVLPYDPVRDEVVLIEQFRIGAMDDPQGPWLIEIIAGYQEAGEAPEEVARREALEEADCMVGQFLPISSYYSSPGTSNEQIHLFLGRTETHDVGGIHGYREEGEDIRVHVLSCEQVFEWMESGRVNSAMPIIALQWFKANREQVRQQWLRGSGHDG
jgi:ADP-ribose pyrophosphatase